LKIGQLRLIVIVFFLICLLSGIAAIQGSYEEDWPTFHYNPEHNGYTENVPLKDNPIVIWTYQTETTISSSVTVYNGYLYFCNNAHTFALNATDGSKIWETAGGVSGPTIDNGVIYTGYNGGTAYNAYTGEPIWTFGGYSEYAPAIVDGIAYFGGNLALYALNASTGTQIWYLESGVPTSPTVYNGKIYSGEIAFNASNGELLWKVPVDGKVTTTPAVYDGYVYFGSWKGTIYCVNAETGAEKWQYSTGHMIISSPAVGNNRVFVGSYDGNLYALNAKTGSKIWNYSMDSAVESSPAIAQDVVYVGCDDGNLYAFFASSGTKLWNFSLAPFTSETQIPFSSSPAITNDLVYVGSSNGALYALGSEVYAVPTPTTPEFPFSVIFTFSIISLVVTLLFKRRPHFRLC
jgi:outer membrane protein assembly factor BamB